MGAECCPLNQYLVDGVFRLLAEDFDPDDTTVDDRFLDFLQLGQSPLVVGGADDLPNLHGPALVGVLGDEGDPGAFGDLGQHLQAHQVGDVVVAGLGESRREFGAHDGPLFSLQRPDPGKRSSSIAVVVVEEGSGAGSLLVV